jgi:hypothetical protein
VNHRTIRTFEVAAPGVKRCFLFLAAEARPRLTAGPHGVGELLTSPMGSRRAQVVDACRHGAQPWSRGGPVWERNRASPKLLGQLPQRHAGVAMSQVGKDGSSRMPARIAKEITSRSTLSCHDPYAARGLFNKWQTGRRGCTPRMAQRSHG